MCTLSFVPVSGGYRVAMNRDELLTRSIASPPSRFFFNELEAVYPQEPSGGTWIGVNSFGNAFALLNVNDPAVKGIASSQIISRGSVIPAIVFSPNSRAVSNTLKTLPLHQLRSFRLVCISQIEHQLFEWIWDGTQLRPSKFSWERRHWFSSSLSDANASRLRGQACEELAVKADPSSKGWLESLHRSHQPAPGPYSVCVHRPDARTVSYTEIECPGDRISMRYRNTSPCLKNHFDASFELAVSQSIAV